MAALWQSMTSGRSAPLHPNPPCSCLRLQVQMSVVVHANYKWGSVSKQGDPNTDPNMPESQSGDAPHGAPNFGKPPC